MSELARIASDRQRQAAAPQASVWVAASAGTGKTKVLTDRVLTLLLAGTLPHRILCLTFTKAAAAEMATRIARRLARWATCADADLAAELAELTGASPDALLLARARRLFAQVLDVAGGMHIETIHAFCQSLLRRFPLEAGLAPHFQVMDDRDAGELLHEARDGVLTQARLGADPALAQALAAVTALIHETAFPKLMAQLAADRGRLKRLMERHGGPDGAMAALRARLELEPGDSERALILRACQDQALDADGLRAAVQSLLEGSDGDRKRGAVMAAFLASPPEQRAGQLDDWIGVFLTDKATIRKTLATKAALKSFPQAETILATEAERCLRLDQRLKAARVAEATAALLALGHALLAGYEARKTARALMDYDDLILAARALLERPGAAPWVLYKLDGGIDHVLIDEAQDTNPDQWAVVGALTAEFFAGRGARDTVRTVFAVGDVKQSIYSFQRADPRAFEDMRHRFARMVPDAGQGWAEIPLNMSFRSTRAVLAAVDAVFAGGGPGGDGVRDGDEDIRHIAFREHDGGLVELWPPVAPRPADELPAWKPPVERIQGDSPRTRLAKLMAARIRALIDGERLESKNRPVRAGDILVLVRRRGAFVEDLVRELKSRAVPVAGADRMVLTDQMAVMDLMALGNALLLPEDDLTLATVLKSPLIGLDEAQLFALADGRGQTGLWETLKARALQDGAFERAWTTVLDLLALTDRMTPFALFAHVLGPLGGRRRLLERLGPEAQDPLDEFMALAQAFERSHPPSLQGFLRWLETGGVEIKRDLEQGDRDAVRIMTVHGSKGLQAPIVFLPDTLQMPTQDPAVLWLGEPEDELMLWVPRADMADPLAAQGREASRLAREREYRRLLYVAMTRAEDRLYVCGWETRKTAPEGCWYNLIRAALAPQAAESEDPFLAAQPALDDARVLRLTSPQTQPVPPAPAPLLPPLPPELPGWAATPPRPEPAPPRPLVPSRPDGEEPPVRSPLSGRDEGGSRFQRGQLIHRLLQSLPDLPAAGRAAAMARYLGQRHWGLTAKERLDIAHEVERVLDHPRFAPLFGPGSRAEVPVAGRMGGRIIAGQVDRLLVGETEVLVVDYKTNRRPPASAAEIPPLYLHQMAAYRLALACIYPGRAIRCALVWTDGPVLMEIDPQRLDSLLEDGQISSQD